MQLKPAEIMNNMKNRIKPTLFSFMLLFVLILGLGTVPVSAANNHEINNGNVYLNTDRISVQIVGGGNLPQFTFWDNADSDNTTYKLKLSSIFEATDDNEDGVYQPSNDSKVPGANVALPPVNWNFSDFDERENGDINFNLTSTNLDFQLQFRFHLYADDLTSIKFDVLVNGYEFAEETAILVLSFSLSVKMKTDTEEETNPDTEQQGSTLNFSDAYFQIEDTASDDNGDIGVGLSAANDGGKHLFIAYQHFTGDLNHDPTIGVRASSLGEENSSSGERIISNTEDLFEDLPLGDTVASSLFATFGFLSIILVISRKKRK